MVVAADAEKLAAAASSTRGAGLPLIVWRRSMGSSRVTQSANVFRASAGSNHRAGQQIDAERLLGEVGVQAAPMPPSNAVCPTTLSRHTIDRRLRLRRGMRSKSCTLGRLTMRPSSTR
jgi:hypothetical protein